MEKKDVSRKNYQGCSVLYFDDDPGLTEQSHIKDCDINYILARYEQDGILRHANEFQGNYADYSVDIDYQTALNTVIEAQDMFMSLPAQVRSKFDNDPGKFLSFTDDPNNVEEMYNLGLMVRNSQSLPDSSTEQVNASDS